jgi:hypothetical protein
VAHRASCSCRVSCGSAICVPFSLGGVVPGIMGGAAHTQYARPAGGVAGREHCTRNSLKSVSATSFPYALAAQHNYQIVRQSGRQNSTL